MLGGYAGKVLFINLTEGTIKEETIPEKTYRDFIGGYGLGIRVLYERMKPKIDPLGPDNMLGFVTGPLTATPVPGSGRFGIVTKSPLTGTWAEANSGGTLGPELKTAGYDAIFFSGISPEPVYLLVKDGKATLENASSVWGKDTYETENILQRELGDGIKIACIGPSGEFLSLLAGIVHEKGRIAARNGVGAVMGSKKLKAVAVKGGFRKIAVADPDKVKEGRQQIQTNVKASGFSQGLTAAGTGGGVSFLVSIGDSPVKNWRLSGLEAMPTVTNLNSSNMDKYKIKSYGCHACTIRCGAIIQQKEGPFSIPGEMHRPEYETLAALGNLLMNDNQEAIIKANDICNRYGMDTMSTGGTLAFAMECYEKGLINRQDTDGIELTWGNASAIVNMTEKMARREGFGAVLADGVARAAERIGKDSGEYGVAILGKSLAYHDPRMSPSEASAFISDANVCHHMDCQITGLLDNGGSVGSDPALQTPRLKTFGDYDKKGPVYAVGSQYHQLLNSAGLCALYATNTAPPPVAELIAGVTGWDFGWAEGLKAAHRVLTLRQAFNAREGITPDKIDLPKRIKDEPLTTGPAANVKIDFTAVRKSYFTEMGWDSETGKPLSGTLFELDLTNIVKDKS